MSKPFYFPVFYILDLSVAAASAMLSKNIPAPTASFLIFCAFTSTFGFPAAPDALPSQAVVFHHTYRKVFRIRIFIEHMLLVLLKHGITLQLRSFILRLHARLYLCDDLTCDRPSALATAAFSGITAVIAEVLRPSENTWIGAPTPTSGGLVVTAVDIRIFSSGLGIPGKTIR